MKTVTITWKADKFIVEYWRGEVLDTVRHYAGMTTAFRFDVCNWLGA
jgi:hypothetical protein